MTKSKRNENITKAHKECFTQSEIAKYLNLSISTVSKIIKNSKFKLWPLLSFPNVSTTNSIKVEWDGAIKESYKTIKYYVKQKDGVNGTLGLFDGDNITGNITGNIPIVIPGGGKYIDIIAKIEKKAGKETGYTASLKELLAKYNAYLFSKSFFGMIKASINSQMTDSATGADMNRLVEINKQINEIYNQVQKEFDDIVKKTNNFKLLADIFKSIDQNFRQEISNSIR